uniref:DUF834 domain-containing protein n=1 Tax=Oryza meridionalis TaxID=40149 RepID=A0A0E0EKV8_9ORYZ
MAAAGDDDKSLGRSGGNGPRRRGDGDPRNAARRLVALWSGSSSGGTVRATRGRGGATAVDLVGGPGGAGSGALLRLVALRSRSSSGGMVRAGRGQGGAAAAALAGGEKARPTWCGGVGDKEDVLRLGLGSWDGDEKVSGGCVEARRWRQWVRGGGGGLCEEEMPVAERGRGNDAGGGKEKATSWESGWMERQMRNFAG